MIRLEAAPAKMDVRSAMQTLAGIGRSVIEKPGGAEFIATWILDLPQMSEVPFAVVPTPWADDEQKRMMVRLLGSLMAAHGSTFFAMASEVWNVRASEDPEIAKLAPSERSDRIEQLMIQGGTADGRRWRWFMDIVRQADGSARVVENGEPVELDATHERMHSWMFDDLFAYGSVPPGLQEIARAWLRSCGEVVEARALT